jgi:A/G-specific adenine glycosylase
MIVSQDKIKEFRQAVLGYYRRHGRHDLPWRQLDSNGSIDPYKVLVSELMLQQTQVSRVAPKFKSFISQFPTFAALSNASLAAVLKAWSGLGYNRRAKFLWQTAKLVVQDHGGTLPGTLQELIRLPGIGANTAGALLAYAYNRPVVFVETNIRTVFIHHFFANDTNVTDKQIADLVLQTLPDQGPGRAARQNLFDFAGAMRNPGGVSHYRVWYWGLMDYGTHLKQTVGNLSARSQHYKKQSAFEGSRRQVRGQVLRVLATGPHSPAMLQHQINDARLTEVLSELTQEGLITKAGNSYTLYEG